MRLKVPFCLSFFTLILTCVCLQLKLQANIGPYDSFQPIALGTYYYDNGLCAPGDTAAVNSFRARAGRLPAVWMIFQGWTGWNKFPVDQAKSAKAQGSSFLVTWEPWQGQVNDSSFSCASIVSGRYDAYIRSYARAVRESNANVLIRLAHEMNGDWYPWGTAYKNGSYRQNGNSPQQYVAMWRHVVQIFRQEKVNNVSWVWAPNIFYMNTVNSQAQQIRDLQTLYPGDSYVDWIGLSVYNDGAARQWSSFSALFDSSYRVLTNLSRKPFMIAELGVTEQGAPRGHSKAQWIEHTFLREIPARYNRVRLVCFFSRDKTSDGQSNYSLDSSPAALRAFRTVANSPLYAGKL
jgi:mannan endo-1,4-beta-mannosidase